jgi:hypothetical protein
VAQAGGFQFEPEGPTGASSLDAPSPKRRAEVAASSVHVQQRAEVVANLVHVQQRAEVAANSARDLQQPVEVRAESHSRCGLVSCRMSVDSTLGPSLFPPFGLRF